MQDVITMCFPAKPEYIPAIRLCVSGIVSKLDFDVEKLENVKTCLSEACMLLLCSQTCNVFHVTIKIGETLRIAVCGSKTEKVETCRGCMEFNAEMSKMLINALCEQVEFLGSGKVLREVVFTVKNEG